MMEPARGNRISDLYHAALALPPEQRRAFLGTACEGDEILREDVESLLAYASAGSSFLEQPAAGVSEGQSAADCLVGRRLGPYTIVVPLGAGGMGEVYRGRDERLGRSVAIKVLARTGSAGDTRRERFQREAQALSRLDHPNICAVYDVGTVDDLDYIVLELLDGETLSDRLACGPLRLAEALEIAIQILAALAQMHRTGLTHRDLKPGNIMLTRSGAKVLDFGLVRFASIHGARSPQNVARTLTVDGAVLGTFQYMAPEALEGREADARSDLFSFGAVLYEMITGRRAFPDEIPARTIGAVLRDAAPSMLDVQPSVPAELDRIVRSCLAKDPDERWQSAHDMRLELQWIREGLEAPGVRTAPRGSRTRPWVAVSAIALFLVGLTFPESGRIDRYPARFPIEAPPGSQFISVGTYAGPPVLSADGQRLAFVGSSPDGRTVLWVRPLGSLQAQPLAGTEGAAYPFWSPDGEHLGFFADQKLKKVSLAGGVITALCDAPYGAGGAWSRSGAIVFAPDLHGPLYRVSAAGGAPVPLTGMDGEDRDSNHRWPVFLPDGRRFLYAAGHHARAGRWTIRVGELDSSRADVVLKADSNVSYASGFLFFVRRGTLVAQPLDERSLRLTGEAVPIAENVLRDAVLGRAAFSVSARGTLVYQTGPAVTGSRLVWLDRRGNELSTLGEPGFYIWPRISPDGERVVVERTDANTGNSDLWVYDVAGGGRLQLTSDPAHDAHPAWTDDGKRVFFTSGRRGFRDLYWIDAYGRGPEEVVLESAEDKFLHSASPGGLIFAQRDRGPGSSSLWLLALTGESKPRRLIGSEHRELFGQVSPDGDWLVYQSSESGRNEIYVTTFPSRAGKWPVSADGGILPRWSADGREVYYLSQDHTALFAAAVGTEGSAFRVSRVERLFSASMVAGRGYPYDVAENGRRFLVVASSGVATSPLTLVLNWDADVRRE